MAKGKKKGRVMHQWVAGLGRQGILEGLAILIGNLHQTNTHAKSILVLVETIEISPYDFARQADRLTIRRE